MKVRRRRIDNIDISRQPSGIRNHSNPYSDAMGPIVNEGFVANRIEKFQGAQSMLVLPPQPRTPKTPGPISERVERYKSCSTPEPGPVPRDSAHSTGHLCAINPENHAEQLASHSFSERRWVQSSPPTPVIRTPPGAALYWDRKIQSLRHPPTREALEIRRLRRGQRSYENVKQTTSQGAETPSRLQNKEPHPEEHHSYSGPRKKLEGQLLSDPEPLRENGVSRPQIQSHKPSVADEIGDMIRHIDQALEGRYDSSVDLTTETQAPDSHFPMDALYGERNASPRRRLFRESQSIQVPSKSDLIMTGHRAPSRSNALIADSGSTSSADGPETGMRDSGFIAKVQRGNRVTTDPILPKSSAGTGWNPTDPIASPDSRPRAWSLTHVKSIENARQPTPKPGCCPASYTLARASATEPTKPPEEPESIRPQINKLPESILEEPKSVRPYANEHYQPISEEPESVRPKDNERHQSVPKEPGIAQPEISEHHQSISDKREVVQPEINDRHQSIHQAPISLSRQPSGANRKVSASSVRSASSHGSKKWRWWKLALVDKQPKGQEPRKRPSTPHLGGSDIRVSKQSEDRDEGTTAQLPVKTILESESERERVSIDEVLDGSSGRQAPALGLHSPSLAEIRMRRSNQWVASLPDSGSHISAPPTPSRPRSLRTSVEQEVKDKDQRIRKVQVIVSLDGASDLVVEASLETRRRKSFG